MADPKSSRISVEVRFKCEIQDSAIRQIFDDYRKRYTFNTYQDWISQLTSYEIRLNPELHCLRRVGCSNTTDYALDQPVKVFQRSFNRTRVGRFIAILALKEEHLSKLKRPVGRPRKSVPPQPKDQMPGKSLVIQNLVQLRRREKYCSKNEGVVVCKPHKGEFKSS